MSNYRFGDDYKLSYYPPDALDCMGGVDWEKVESVEIEGDVYVKERTCKPDESDGWHKCPECGCVVGYWLLNDDSWTIYMDDCQIPFNACPNCGAKVRDE